MEPSAKLKPFNVLKPDTPVDAPTGTGAAPSAIEQALKAGVAAGIFVPRAATPTSPTLPPFAMTAAAVPRAAAASVPLDEPEPERRPSEPSSAALIRTFTLVVKLSISASILLGGAYFTMKSIVPVIKELVHPGGTDALHNKDAPVFVKAIQQTRQVVAKNDANVAYLNSLVGESPTGGGIPPITPLAAAAPGQAAAQPAEPAPVGTKAPVPAPKPVKSTTYAPSSSSSSQSFVLNLDAGTSTESAPSAQAPAADLGVVGDAVDRLKIDGVVGGRSPRIIIDGLLVRAGEMADRRFQLKFIGVDADKHLLFFTNADNAVFKRHY